MPVDRLFCSLMASFLFFSSSQIFAAESSPALVSVVDNNLKSTIGELGRENDTHIEILDLQSGEGQIFKKADLKSIRKDVKEQIVIDRVSLPVYMSWRIKKVLPNTSASGKIAQVDGATIYVTLGSNVGLTVGSELLAYRGDMEIKDPDTGTVLGKQRRKIANLQVISVEPMLAKAKIVNDLEVKLEIGDVVEPDATSNSVVILPLVNSSGNETEGTKQLAEQLTTGLVGRGVSVVERRLLDKVMNELALQQEGEYDPAKAQQIGKQLGAYATVIGTVAPKGKVAEAQFRLVSVATGEILIAATQILKDSGDLVGTELAQEKGSKTTTTKNGKGRGKYQFSEIFTFTDEKQTKDAWEIRAKEELWSIQNTGIRFAGEPGADLVTKSQFSGEVAVDFSAFVEANAKVGLHLFGENLEVVGPSEIRIQVLRKDNSLLIRLNGKDSTTQLKESLREKPTNIRISWRVIAGFGRDKAKALIKGIAVKAEQVQQAGDAEKVFP